MKRLFSIVKTGLNTVLVLTILFFLYALFCRRPVGEAYVGTFDSTSCDEGWFYRDLTSGDRIELSLPAKVYMERGETLTMYNTLPEEIRTGMSLSFRNNMQDVEIRIDGELRGSYGRDGFEHSIGAPPSSYILVDLTSEDALKDIEISVSPYKNGMTYLNAPEYSYGNNVWFHYISNNILITFVAVSLILIGIIAIAVFLFLRKKVFVGDSFFYLAQLVIVVSLWILSESRIRQLFFSAPYYTTVLTYILIEIIAAYGMLYVDELQGHYYRRVFTVIQTLIFAQLIINSILNFTGVVFYTDTLIFSHIWTVVALIAMLVTLILDLRTGRIKKYSIAACGIAGVVVSAIGELIAFYITDKSNMGMTVGFGLLFLIGMTLSQTVLDILMLKQQNDMNEVAAHIANEANRAKSDFLAQMSHEIRTPINAVLGMNEMILRESREEQVLEYAANAYNAGKTLLSIINDILDISKIEAGKLEIVETEYDLYSLISDCYHMTVDRAEKNGLKFIYRVEEDLPIKLKGDMFHIRQVVVNFLTNAIKYTDEGSVELLFSGEYGEEGFSLQVSVRDTGIGLTEESKEKLFQRFQRFDLKRNQSIEGTGLGLSICKRLTELMGGEVIVESEYGKGSTFRCRIPQEVINSTPVGKVELEHVTYQRNHVGGREFVAEDARILVVDDVEMNLVVFRSLLKGHKLKIEEVTSGRRCLELIQKQTYDIIFMDHMMPEMDGIETFEQMKKMRHLNRETPVIMLTANAISGEKEKYMAAGFASYLTKPIQSDKLEEALLTFLPEEKVKWKENGEETQTRQDFEKEHATAAEYDTGSDQGLLDIALGISYTGGSEEAYLTVLESYLKGGGEKLAGIRRFCENGEWKNYVTSVHSLKSTSLTIGARKLSEAAKELEERGKAEEYEIVREKNEAMLELYEEVLKAGDEFLKNQRGGNAVEDSAGNLREIKREELLSFKARLQDAAESFDNDEIITVCDALSGYSCDGESLTKKFVKVRELAMDFEYEEAGNLASEIFGELLEKLS